MAGDLVIEEGDLEVLRDRTRDLSSSLQSVTVATGVGGRELAELGRSAGETIDDAVMAVSRDLDDFSQSVNDSINAYNATENDAAVTFQHTAHGGPAMTMDDLLRMREEQ